MVEMGFQFKRAPELLRAFSKLCLKLQGMDMINLVPAY